MKVVGHDHKFVQLICGTSVVKKCLYQELCVLRLLKQSAPLPSLRSDKVSLLIISGGLSNRLHVPSGAKAQHSNSSDGTAEAVPLQGSAPAN